MIGTSSGKTIMATNKVLGRSTAGTGAIEEISIGSNLTLSGGTLSASGGVTGVAASATDVLSVSGSDIAADDPGADRLVFWDDSDNKLTYLTAGSGLTITGTTITASGGIGGSTGSVDNAILRADSTGGATLQSSDINIDDATTSTQNNVAITNQHSGQTNSALVLTPKGTGALIAGPKPDGTSTGGNARGTRAVDLQTDRNAATQVASGNNSVLCGGFRNTAAGSQSFIGSGQNNIISGGIPDRCVIVGGSGNKMESGNQNTSIIGCGQNNNISGYYSGILSGDGCSIAGGHTSFIGGGVGNQTNATVGAVVCGNRNSATGQYAAILGGNVGIADRYNMQVHSAGSFVNDLVPRGDAQRARFVMRNKTTTNAAVELFLDGSSTRLTIPSGKIFAFTINISGVKSDGSAVAHYLRQYCLKNVAGTCTEVYAPVTIGTDNAAGTSIALSAYDVGATEALKVEVTGIAAETWRWVASVDAVEIAYGN